MDRAAALLDGACGLAAGLWGFGGGRRFQTSRLAFGSAVSFSSRCSCSAGCSALLCCFRASIAIGRRGPVERRCSVAFRAGMASADGFVPLEQQTSVQL